MRISDWSSDVCSSDLFIAERLFLDDEEVANAPRQNFGEVRGGDIEYMDVNQDGEITALDKVPLGYPTVPEINYGSGLSAGYGGVRSEESRVGSEWSSRCRVRWWRYR